MTRTDGAKIYCDYNEYGELAAFEASHNGHLIDAEFIVYDNAGQIQSIDRMHGFTASSEEYGYDSILRLKTVVAGGDLIESYAHDIDGNRVSANEINTNL